LDGFQRNLGYSLLVLIGLGFFYSQPTDHGGWLAAKGGMRSLAVVELDPFSNAGLAPDPVSQACR
jgi:hypothetical protein